RYTYQVFDGETQTVASVTQEILSYEKSDLFQGRAFKVKTRLHGQEVFTWMDLKGRPVLEMSLGGVIIAELESKKAAERYLAQAALNKDETLINFSLIRTNTAIPEPGRVKTMEVALSGIPSNVVVPSDLRQRCGQKGSEWVCRIQSDTPDNTPKPLPGNDHRYLKPSYAIPSSDPKILRTARRIAGGESRRHEQIRLLMEWIKDNIQQAPVDVYSAIDVLEGKKAECQGHTLLYTAFARGLGIPTRVANGIVYTTEFKGFLYHTWAESLVDGHWIAVDPIFHQIPADATHIKLIEGEAASDLVPLVTLIGKLSVRIIAAEDQ
ncbi:MAG: transglutaminase domain-containing protein, partial [bacterium]